MPSTGPTRSAHPSGTPREPRNGLGTVTFVLVVLAALLAVFPATAVFGFLLCLIVLVPAIVAYRRTRRGTATNRRRSTAGVVLAPAFLLVSFVVVGATTPPQVGTASDAIALPDTPPSAAAPSPAVPLLATPAPTSAVDAGEVAVAPSTAVPQAARKASPRATTSTVTRPPAVAAAAPARPGQAVRDAAPAPVAKAVAKPAPSSPSKAAPSKAATSKAAPSKAAPSETAPSTAASSAACNDDTHYVNTKGNCVPRPVAAPTAPDGATAKCEDGTYSFSQSRSGTCSGHGGVAQWL